MGESDILDKWFELTAERKMRRHQFTEAGFDEIARAIGRLLLAWNDLHEKLLSIFVTALGGGWAGRPLALWHSARNDVGKRNLLLVTLDQIPTSELGSRTKLVKELKWILSNAEELEGKRDDAAHTPMLDYNSHIENFVAKALLGGAIFADDFMGNKRAQRLNQKGIDLHKEFEYTRKRIIILRDYAIAIDLAWTNDTYSWPDRPKLPNPPPRTGGQSRDAKRNLK